eukprot:m.159656 g.159656  ORF g.159656 m.159656 type:complete len:303 (+) comp31144_c0_seq1:95-1003(+)
MSFSRVFVCALVSATAASSLRASVPTAVDWEAAGKVTPVNNELECGSTWAFAAVGAIESAYAIAKDDLIQLSTQQMVDCDHTNQGCNGGSMISAFEWVSKNNPLCPLSEYPYLDRTHPCQKCKAEVGITGYKIVNATAEALMEAVAQQPVTVAVNAGNTLFEEYTGGIIDSPKCGNQLDHALLAVGYGTENGVDYWKLRNQWGESWGENGYVRIVRGKNMCGVETEGSYPIGACKAGDCGPPVPPPPPPSPPPSPPPPPPSQNECNPSLGCNVCKTCCAEFIPDGHDCDLCVQTRCTAVADV